MSLTPTALKTDIDAAEAFARTPQLPALRAYQAEAGQAIVDSVMNGRGLTFTVVMARQAGKNELSAQIELFLLLKHARRPVEGIKCAPTFDPQGKVSLRRLWSHVVQAGLQSVATRDQGRSVRLGQARMLFLSAEPTANVVGHTAGLLLEVDEAQDVEIEKFEREFRPMASSTGATTVFYGTPWDDSTLLERAAQHNLDLQRHDGVQRHFSADWTQAAEANPAYARYVESERARLGDDHPLFRTQYALKTIAGKGRLFSGGQRAQLQGRHQRRHTPSAGETYVAGLDLGGQDWHGNANTQHDATILTIARVVSPTADAIVQEPRLEVVEHVKHSGTAHDALFARLADLLKNVWQAKRVVVDATGLGETMARLLAGALGTDVVQALKFSADSKSRLGYGLLAAVNGGRLKVYAADGSSEYAEFWCEMETARANYRPSRQINFFVDPSDGHDDYLMSLAMAVDAGGNLDARPRIARGRIQE
ncbi:MAG: hypothetical protein IH957_04225 [Chloroflexi bacterium]|nr:hypothetical protein [Chloroflexota bacterium]